jgi:hypothetical protein
MNIFLKDNICEHITEQMIFYVQQKIHEKILLGGVGIRTGKDKMKLLFGVLLLQGIVQEPEWATIFLETDFWQRLFFTKLYQKRDFFNSSELSSFCRQ